MYTLHTIDREKIAASLSIGHLPFAKQESLIAELEEQISDSINLALLEKMSETEREEFLNLVDTNDDQKVLTYLEEKIPDFRLLIEEISGQSVEQFQSA